MASVAMKTQIQGSRRAPEDQAGGTPCRVLQGRAVPGLAPGAFLPLEVPIGFLRAPRSSGPSRGAEGIGVSLPWCLGIFQTLCVRVVESGCPWPLLGTLGEGLPPGRCGWRE